MSNKNPWIPQGISIFDPRSMLPIVGQKELFQKLLKFKQDMLSSSQLMTGFFALVGGWGVGKSRVGHEICLEAIDPDAEWVVDRRGRRLLEPGLQEGVLPLFLRYSHVTDSEHLANDLSYETWIPICARTALSFLVDPPATKAGSINRRNQSNIVDGLVRLLNAKGFANHRESLAEALKEPDHARALEKALDVLKQMGIRHLLIVIDEIEDVTDVEREGLPDEDRERIDEAFLTVIPRVIKREDVRLDFPQVNFLLLTARSAARMLSDVKALERRTGYLELQTNAFHDVEDYFHYIKTSRPTVWQTMEDYTPGLKEATFFASNRNFGWFNVIMSYCHENHRGGKVPVPKLLQDFAEFDSRAERSVFDIKATSDTMIPKDADKPRILDLIYAQLPQRIGSNGGLDDGEAKRLFTKRYSGTDSPLFSPVVEVDVPRADIPRFLREAGFEWDEGSTFVLPGEGRFDVDLILDSLASYSIGLSADDRGHLLVFKDVSEFTEQLRGLTPYDNEAVLVAEPLHQFLCQEAFRVADGSDERCYLAPSFSFLLKFNRLNKRVQADIGYLRDPKLNSDLSHAFETVQRPSRERTETLLKGVAQAWEEDHVVDGAPAPDLQSPSFVFSTNREPLNLGADGRVTLVFAAGNKEAIAALEGDLKRLAPSEKHPAHPVILIVEGTPDREEELTDLVRRVAPPLAPFVIARSFSSYQVDVLLRQGFMGEVFSPNDLRTSQFASGLALARQHLARALQGHDAAWLERLEQRGLVLRPVFFRRNITRDDYRVLATGYALMSTGLKTFSQLLRDEDDTFSLDDTDLFRKRVNEHVAPPAKYEGEFPLGIFAERGGTFETNVPRQLVAVLQSFGTVARTPTQLVPMFLYSCSDPRPQDIVRQVCGYLEALGFLEAEGAGKYRRVSGKLLNDGLNESHEWLTCTGVQCLKNFVKPVRAMHDEAASNVELRAKEMRELVEKAQARTSSLSLSFLDSNWDELEEVITDPVTGTESATFEVQFSRAVSTVAEVRRVIERVYDPQRFKELAESYSADLLPGFEQDSVRPDYPLWKRVAILSGFYSSVANLRSQLIDRIKEHSREGHDAVEDGPSGQKVFPTQVLTNVLKVWQQEINFPSNEPQRSVRVGDKSLGVMALGIKIAQGKYQEAWQRLLEIERELTEPNKLPARYFDCLGRWRELLQEQTQLLSQVNRWVKFFDGASDEVRHRFRIDDLVCNVDQLACDLRSGIREGTDDREEAGQPIFDLIKGLEQDLAKVSETPPQINSRLQGLEPGILEGLVQEFEKSNRDVLGAYARILTAQNKSQRSWPSKLAENYCTTRKTFVELVEQAENDLKLFFDGVQELTWEDFVGLSKLDAEQKDIPWEQQPYSDFVRPLQQKGLVKLRLI